MVKYALCCDQVPKPVSVGVNIHRPEVIRDGRRDCKTILIIIFIAVIILILSATCAGTVYTLLQLLRLKSEIGYASTALMEFGDNSRDSQVNASSLNMLHQQINYLTDTLNNSIEEKEQLKMMNASFDVLRQQINDLAGTFNTSNQRIQVRENKKEHITNASLDILHQQINHRFSFHLTSCAAILLFNSSSPSGYYFLTSSNGSSVRVYCDMTLSCGNITGGWMRVANLDTRDINTQCPGPLRERMDSSIRTCESPPPRGCYQITYLQKISIL